MFMSRFSQFVFAQPQIILNLPSQFPLWFILNSLSTMIHSVSDGNVLKKIVTDFTKSHISKSMIKICILHCARRETAKTKAMTFLYDFVKCNLSIGKLVSLNKKYFKKRRLK